MEPAPLSYTFSPLPSPASPSAVPDKPLVFLDLDGVCVDFITAACALHGTTPDQIDWARHGFYISDGLGITRNAFWAPITAGGAAFWEGLDPYPWFEELLDAVADAEVYVCSSPSLDPGSLAGKVAWMYRHFPKAMHRRFVLTGHKHLLARPGRFLVDDADHNAEKWARAGGTPVLFPRPWNSAAAESADPVAAVRRVLAAAQ